MRRCCNKNSACSSDKMSCQGMKRWVGRVAVVTGASEGTIGGAIATDLVRHGMTVIGCARNVSQVEVS